MSERRSSATGPHGSDQLANYDRQLFALSPLSQTAERHRLLEEREVHGTIVLQSLAKSQNRGHPVVDRRKMTREVSQSVLSRRNLSLKLLLGQSSKFVLRDDPEACEAVRTKPAQSERMRTTEVATTRRKRPKTQSGGSQYRPPFLLASYK